MAYLSEDFVSFFKELEQNNRKEWFDAQRNRYKSSVKEPFTALIEEMIQRIQKEGPSITLLAQDALLRINRDIRFSPDKTPYNTHYGAIISPVGRKDKSIPGIYFRFSHQGIEIFGGAHSVDKLQLQAIRSEIARNPEKFEEAIHAPEFRKFYGQLLGEKHKRLPAEFNSLAEKYPLIANKQFYYGGKLPVTAITAPDLPDQLMEFWQAARPVRDFLLHAMISTDTHVKS